jgi:hypothetical protein
MQAKRQRPLEQRWQGLNQTQQPLEAKGTAFWICAGLRLLADVDYTATKLSQQQQQPKQSFYTIDPRQAPPPPKPFTPVVQSIASSSS